MNQRSVGFVANVRMNVTHHLLHCASHCGYVFNMDETISTRRFGIGYLQKTCVVDIDAPGVWHGRIC